MSELLFFFNFNPDNAIANWYHKKYEQPGEADFVHQTEGQGNSCLLGGDRFVDSEEILIIQFFCFQSVPVGKETSFYSGLAGDTGPTEIRENSNEVISYSRLSFTCLIKESLSEGSPPSWCRDS